MHPGSQPCPAAATAASRNQECDLPTHLLFFRWGKNVYVSLISTISSSQVSDWVLSVCADYYFQAADFGPQGLKSSAVSDWGMWKLAEKYSEVDSNCAVVHCSWVCCMWCVRAWVCVSVGVAGSQGC